MGLLRCYNKIEVGLEEGDIVRVLTHDKKFIAVGHFQIGSIAVRVLSFHDVKIDDTFLGESIECGPSSAPSDWCYS